MTRPEVVSLVLLAGGRGARLGGQDKGLMTLASVTLVERLLAHVAPKVNECLVVANRHLQDYRRLVAPFGAQVIEDDCGGFQGPLMGMLTGLRHARGEWVLVLPCDAARLPLELLARLQQHQQQTQTSAVFAAVGTQDYPVCCLLQRALVTSLAPAFLAGSRSPSRWLASIGASRCDLGVAGEAACWSINTAEELARELRSVEQQLVEQKSGEQHA